MELRHLSIRAERALTTDRGEVEAVVAVFEELVPSYAEVVARGAFARTLADRKPAILWMHNSEVPVGRVTEAEEVDPGDERLPESIREKGGLLVKFQMNLETQAGREAFSNLKNGVVDEFSIGFVPRRTEEFQTDAGETLTRILDLDLYEVSIVLWGAQPKTALLGTRSEGMTLEQQKEFTLEAVDGVLTRLADLRQLRESEGKTVSEAHVQFAKDLLKRVQDSDILLDGKEEPATRDDEPDLEARARTLLLKTKCLTNYQTT